MTGTLRHVHLQHMECRRRVGLLISDEPAD